MRRYLACILSIMMLLSFTACQGQSQSAASGSSSQSGQSAPSQTNAKSNDEILVGFCANDTTSQFIADLTNSVKEKFAQDGIELQIASAANDSATQISQIENFATMKANVIIIIPVDPTSCGDALRRAQNAGSKVLVLNSDTGAYDSIMHSDRYAIGKSTAQLAADWINETFADAAPGSVEIAIFENRDTPEMALNSDGLLEINNFTDKVTIVQTFGGMQTNTHGQESAAALFQTHPDVKAIVCAISEIALGANAYAMRPDSKVSNLSEFGVFAADFTPEIAKHIKDSTEDKSTYRGSVKFGGDDLPGDIYSLAKKMAMGEDYPKEWVDPYIGIDRNNIDQYLN